MHETPQGFFHLDLPASDAAISSGLVKLAGWAAGTGGRHFVDLRIRTGTCVHPAVYGFPRADLAAFFQLPAPFLAAGFEALLVLPSGAVELVFEALDITGHWHRLHSLTLQVRPAPVAVDKPTLPAIQPHEFARTLLNAMREGPENDPGAQAAALPRPAVLRFPHLPFHGHLHQPTLTERVLFGRLRIEGWLFHETARIRRVVASADLQAWQVLQTGGRKDYVEAMYPQFSNAKDCRIDGLIDVPSQLPAPLCIRLCAQLDDGSWHLCQVQRVRTWDQEAEKPPLTAYSPSTFFRRAWDLNRRCREQGFAVPRTRAFWQGLRLAHAEYRLRARPVSSPAATPAATGRFNRPVAHAAPTPRRIVLFTHNLAHEGAPLFLVELAREYRTAGVQLHVVAAADGPLAARYHELGATHRVVSTLPLLQSADRREAQRALADLTREIDLGSADLVVANTLSMWWAVHLADRAGKPSLLYLHESTTPATFYLGHMSPRILPLIQSTFRLATCVSFLTEATRQYYRPWLGRDNHGINPGWIDVAAIDAQLAKLDRPAIRQQLGIGPDTQLVINVGSVCDRKGQHIFARGVDLFWRQHPAAAARCRFLVIGGRDTLFDGDLQALLRQFDRPNLTIVPATAEPLAYYRAADFFVCSSYEESLPRVIMEAMVARLPILSTGVHGILDLLPDPEHGRLIPPGNSQAICDGLHDVLTHGPDAAARAARARDHVVQHFNSATLLPGHVALAACVASPRP